MKLRDRIFSVTDEDFGDVALAVFRYQAGYCPPYKQYLELLGVDPTQVSDWKRIPYLPVEFFKTYRVYSDQAPRPEPDVVFTSSGTTGSETSRHEVADIALYEEAFVRGFEYFYGSVEEWSVFALLPGYMEREGSSLVYMAERLQGRNREKGGFYLHDYSGLKKALEKASETGEKIWLIGVAFALLDFAEYLKEEGVELRLPEHAVVLETGGMKGRRREITREEMHGTLCRAFGVPRIHSEYGMTELLSQAYSDGEGVFRCPPWMKITLRDVQNPLKNFDAVGRPGGINVIDLANLYSCSFLAIQDKGVLIDREGAFSVSGRLEGAQIRGCNMLVE